MAQIRRITDLRGLFAVPRGLFAIAVLCAPGFAQIRLTLEQACTRTAPDFTPVYEGKEVAVRGQVSAKPLWAVDSYYLPIQDEAEYGLLLWSHAAGSTAPAIDFNAFAPGDWVEATGVMGRRSGMPILLPREVRLSGHSDPPAPKELRLDALNGFRYLGLLITAQSRITTAGENGSGDIITLADRANQINIFLPKLRRSASASLQGYRPGDLVRATGIAMQYCSLPPYDRSYEILLANAGGLTLIEKAWLIPPSMLLTALIVIMALVALWSLRERHMAKQRRTLRALNSLGEEVTGGSSPAEIVRKLMVALSKMMRISGVGVFTCNRQTQTLDSFYGEGTAVEYGDMEPLAAPIFEAASVAFRNRTLLSIPDSRRSPLFTTAKNRAPRSALFVPMFAQAELVGVLEIENSARVRYFGQEEQAALQHLANQAAAALRLQEQHSIREQRFRSEKLASASQLMSGIANELRAPIESTTTLAAALHARYGESDPRIASLIAEARRAWEIVQRLLTFSRYEEVEAEPVDLNEMLSDVVDVHDSAAGRPSSIVMRRRLSNHTLMTYGSREQLAQVVLNLLIYAEQSLADARGPSEIRIASALLARRAMIEISWPARITDADPDRSAADLIEKTGLSLEVCHGIINNHGGELRVSQSAGDVRFELDLPVMETKQRAQPLEKTEQHGQKRQLTILVVEPEANSQRHLVDTFTGLSHRVVPVASAEEGIDLVERMRFDVAVCALRLPGLSWADFLERVRGHVGGVVLLTDAYDPNLMRTFQSSEVVVLNKPADAAELKHVCETIEECGDHSAIAR